MEDKQINLSDLKPIKSESLDLKQFNNKTVKVEKVYITQVPSSFTPLKKESTTEHIPQWVLKVESEVVASIGEGDEKIDFRASELFNLIQDDEGNLKGFPDGEKSNLKKFMNDIGVKKPEEIIGKPTIVKVYDKKQLVDGKEYVRQFMKFKY